MTNRRGIGRTEIMIGVAVVVLLALIVGGLMMGSSSKSNRAEVPLNVDAIRTAEITYQEAFEDYVSASAAPRAATAVNEKPVAWNPTEGFKKLAWAPENEEAVYGSYQVVAKEDGFTVTGTCDVDGDGNRAVYTANAENNAQRDTPEDVY